MQTDDLLKAKYATLLPHLNEKEVRLVLAADARSMGRGGLSKVSKLSGRSRVTLNAGLIDLSRNSDADSSVKRSRKVGGGRKKAKDLDKSLLQVIENIVSPHTMGDLMKTLQWTSKSLRKISNLAKEKGYNVSHKLVGELLKSLGYSLQSNRKTDEGGTHEDWDAQFEHINKVATSFLNCKQPVISVDCKKKEVLGNIKNPEQEWIPSKEPTKVKVYDFVDKELGKAIPYGVYDIANNEGWVSVGIDHDTASFAVSTIRSWWNEMGANHFETDKLFIPADGGGSNSSRSRLWKKELQLFANETGLEITVSHYPPSTSKWNKIEHRLFSYISMNWKAKPLISIQFVLDLIASTTTTKGLKVRSKLDSNLHEKGQKISDEELESIKIKRDKFHGEWNYVISPIYV
ncbi:MAG: ISAzo13 family transposase [bacterium]|nr:ISAzo13 family transposase [bacterium]